MKKLALCAGVLAALAITYLLWPAPDVPSRAPLASNHDLSAPEHSRAQLTTQPEQSPEPDEHVREEVTPDPARFLSTDADRPSRVGSAHIIGRVTLPGGAPAIDASVELKGSVANSMLAAQFGMPTGWLDPAVQTGEDGRFDLAFDPPGAYQFRLKIRLAPYAEENWTWVEFKPGATEDVGTVELRPTGVITGRVLSADGEPVRMHSLTASFTSGEWQFTGHTWTGDTVLVQSSDGSFRLEGAPAGPAKLSANSPLTGPIDGPTVQVVPGTIVEADIRYRGKSPSRTIQVFARVDKFGIVGHDTTVVRLEGEGLSKLGRRPPNTAENYLFEDLDPGTYTVTVQTPGCFPWSRPGLSPGDRVTAHLTPTAGVQVLSMIDAVTGEPVRQAAFSVRLDDYLNHSPNTFEVLPLGPLPIAGLVTPIIPGNVTLIADAPGFAPAEVPLPELGDEELRPVRIELERAASISGRVEYPGSEPAAHIEVVLRSAKSLVPEPEPGRPVSLRIDDLRETYTDATGHFVLDDLPFGLFDVLAIKASYLVGTAEDVELDTGAHPGVRITVPRGAELTARLEPPSSLVPRDFALVLRRPENPPTGFRNKFPTKGQAGRDTFAERGSNGAWHLTDLPAGTGELLMGSYWITNNGWRSTNHSLFSLGPVELSDGEHLELVLDPADFLPGRLELDVFANDKPARKARVSLVNEDRQEAKVTQSNGLGHATFEGVFGGTYQVRVAFDPQTVVTGPQAIEVASGETSTGRVELWAETRPLLATDKTGTPLANTLLHFLNDTTDITVKTDAQGHARATLPIGDFEASFTTTNPETGRRAANKIHIAWSAPSSSDEPPVTLTFDWAL